MSDGELHPSIPCADRPKDIVSVTHLEKPPFGRVCGIAMDKPGKYGDWLCHQVGTRTVGWCRAHAYLAEEPVGLERGETHKRGNLLSELNWGAQFRKLRDDPELLSLEHDAALIDVQINSALRRINHKAGDTKENQKRLTDLIELRRKLVDSAKKNRDDDVVLKTEVFSFTQQMINIFFRFVKDPRDRSEILRMIRDINPGHRGDQPMQAIDVAIDVTPAEKVG